MVSRVSRVSTVQKSTVEVSREVSSTELWRKGGTRCIANRNGWK